MDLASIIGVVGALVVITVVMILDGGSPAELFEMPQAILLVVAGALVAAVVSQPMSALGNIPKWFMIGFFEKGKHDPAETINLLSGMADKARREGLLALEEEAKKIEDDFLKRGIMMVVDGVDPAQVRAILEIEIKHMHERHEQGGIGFFNAVGGYAPTFGIIGTVMALVTVLKALDDPGSLGPKIAGAFLATLWGILSANVLWLPLAGKLSLRNQEEVNYYHMLLEGILALQAGENPRVVKDKLSAFLAPKERASTEAAAKA
ncbi:MAG: motility protein A [Chloroflexota bacterium]|jgi:chemotaxis protein MotA